MGINWTDKDKKASALQSFADMQLAGFSNLIGFNDLLKGGKVDERI